MENVVVEKENYTFGDLPPEFKDLYNTLYKKISGMVGGEIVNLRSDPTTIRILFESTMTIVEKARNADGKAYSGPEKRAIAMILIKTVINDLAKNGKIPKEISAEINAGIDFWGGLIIDIAISAAKKLFDVGQEFVKDTREKGCKAACKENFCCCCVTQ